MQDKYDHAITWLRDKDRGRGSYYEEVASLLEELLFRVWELENSEAAGEQSRWRVAPPRRDPKLRVVPPVEAPRGRSPR